MITSRRIKKGKEEKVRYASTDSESNVLTTLPSMHMALTRDQAQNLAYLSATPTKTKITTKKTQRRNLNSAPSARVN